MSYLPTGNAFFSLAPIFFSHETSKKQDISLSLPLELQMIEYKPKGKYNLKRLKVCPEIGKGQLR